MAAFAIPAAIALLFKLALLAYAIRAPRKDSTTRLFVLFLGLFALHNLIEISTFIYFGSYGVSSATHGGFEFGYAYFAVIILCIALTLHVSLRISIDQWEKVRHIVPLLYSPVPVLEYLLLFTDKLISGFQPFQYSVLRIPGPSYILFEIYATLYPLAVLVYLIYGARRSRPSVIARTRNRLWLYGLLPLVLLHLYLVIGNHFGIAKISSTVSIPVALTVFLAVTTYATHQYRLFDIEFYIPWSKVRKRKTAFYKRIQATIGEIADLKSVNQILDLLANALHCQVALIGGPRPVLALANGQQVDAKNDLLVSEFPRDALRTVDHIVVANEIADSRPALYQLMTRHKVGAIVPFNAHSGTSAHWMLLGERFSDEVYTPLDFKVVETLFDRIGERFLDNMLLLRSQLREANEELRDYQRRLTVAWSELESLRKTLARTEQDNKALREEKAHLVRQSFHVVDSGLPDAIESGRQTLAEYMTESEREIVRAALRDCGGNKIEAARLLGIRPRTLHYLVQRHNLEPEIGG